MMDIPPKIQIMISLEIKIREHRKNPDMFVLKSKAPMPFLLAWAISSGLDHSNPVEGSNYNMISCPKTACQQLFKRMEQDHLEVNVESPLAMGPFHNIMKNPHNWPVN